MDVNAPDGKVIGFPDSMSKEQVQSAMGKLYPKPSTQPRSFGESMGARAGEALDQKPSGIASFVRKKVLGFDPLTLLSKASGVMEAPLGAAGETLERKAGQAVGANPIKLEKAARDTGDVTGGLTGILPGPKIAKAGERLSAARHDSFVNDLVSPVKTKKVKLNDVDYSTEKGFNKKVVTSTSPRQKAVAAEVKKLPVSRSQSPLGNYNIIKDANYKKGDALQAAVKKSDVSVGANAVFDARNKAIKAAFENPYVVAARPSAKTVVETFNKSIMDIVKKNGGKLKTSDLFQARKNFDNAMESYKPKVFDSTVDNATSEMTHHLRTALNDLIESKLPNEGYKKTLREQNLLYEAMKNLKPKAAAMPGSVTKRIMASPVTKYAATGAGIAAAGAGGAKYGKDIFGQ